MINEEVIKFFEHYPSLYIKTVKAPYIHGLFTDKDALAQALEDIQEDKTLYFVGHSLKDIDFVPVNSFMPIEKGKSIKKENIDGLRYLVLDIDPVNGATVVNDKTVKRNLTIEENQTILTEAAALRTELIKNGINNIGLINSGNGAYLLFPFNTLKNPDKNISILKQFAEIIKQCYNFSSAQIDISTIKTTQCFKLPGTLSTKGEATEDNPFRHAVIVEDWDDNKSKSCWKAIKAYVEKNMAEELVVHTSFGTKLDLPACMCHCQKVYPVFRGQNREYYARIEENGCLKDLKLDSVDFISELRIHLRKVTGMLVIYDKEIDAIITFLRDEAYQKETSVLASRAYFDRDQNVLNYDLCNNMDIVEITPTSISTKPKPLGMFEQKLTDKEQVAFVPTPAKELPQLLSSVANVVGRNLLILATFLCVCFLGNIFPTPILLITGPQGTSKSTLTRYIQEIVHPQKISSLSLSAKLQDISIALSTRLLTCFDNASGVKAEVADLLCSAVTKGCFQTRELYTTSDERLIEFKSIICINGIDIISRRTDLMQRCIMLELEPIKPENRKTEKEVEATFKEALPQILGAIFDAIQKVLAMGEIELSALSRMADFEEWAVKFAIAMGYDKEEYQIALKENQQRLVDAVSFGNPVVFAVVELMRGKREFRSSFQEFYVNCYDILKEKATPNELSMFPKSPAALSRALGGMEENLKSFGITFRSDNVGAYKEATITNDGTVIPVNSVEEISGKLAYEMEKDNQTK